MVSLKTSISSVRVASNDRIVNEYCIGKDLKESSHGPI